MRTDLELHGALSLADFPELATARVIYSALDLMFFSNREAREEGKMMHMHWMVVYMA